MKWVNCCLIALYIFMSVFEAHAQDKLRFKKITKDLGLSNNAVLAITQDDQGFIWLGTRNGLNRYDGYRIVTYRYNQKDSTTIVSNDIRSLFFDKKTESLWLGTRNGLSQFVLNQQKFINYFEKERYFIVKVMRDSKDRLLIGTTTGLFQILDNGEIREILINHASLGRIREIHEDNNGQLWITSDDNIYVNKAKNWDETESVDQIFSELDILKNTVVSSMEEDLQGNLWFGTQISGVFKWNSLDKSITRYLNDKESIGLNEVRDIITDEQGKVWIGTINGIYINDAKSAQLKHVYNDGSYYRGLNNNSIKSLYKDNNGGIWVGTYFRGANYYDQSFERIKVILPFEEGPDDDKNIINVLTSDNEDLVWVGTAGSGLASWDNRKKNFEFLNLDNTLTSANIKSIYPLEKDLWIGTLKNGLFRYSKVSKEVTRFANQPDNDFSLPSNDIYDIEYHNNDLWMASLMGGVIKQIGEGQFVSFTHNPNDLNSISSTDCRVLHEDKEGELWVGTNIGLNKLEETSSGEVSFNRFLPLVTVYCINSFMPNEIWIGTSFQGLYKYEKASGLFTNYTKNEGLPGNTIYSIQKQGDNLWLTTDEGIAKFNTTTNEVVAFKQYSELRGLEFSQNSGLNLRNRDLLFGSNKGLVQFQPSEISQNAHQTSLVISDFKILNNESEFSTRVLSIIHDQNGVTKEIELKNHESTIEIKLSNLEFASPDNIRFAYRMKGLDDVWRYSDGKTEAVYNFQREGKYRFEAKATNADGIWSPSILQLDINIQPPWYRSWWAYLLYVVFFTALIYMLYRMIRLQNSYQLEHIANLERERSHELKTRFFTNITHELKTPLTLIQGPLKDIVGKDDLRGPVRNKLEGVQKNVVRLSLLVNQLMDIRKMETDHMRMQVSKGDIIEFLKEVYFAFREETTKRNIDFIFETKTDAIRCWFDADKMEKVFFNLLSNALKFTPDAGLIKVIVEEQKEIVKVTIEDNGRGIDDDMLDQIFERFYERSTLNYSNYGVGIGLALSKQLVELHSGSIYALKNETVGTSFVVELPKGSSHFKQEEIIQVSNKLENNVKPVSQPDLGVLSNDHKEYKVLIVEDEEEIQQYIRSLFTDKYHVLVAFNGQEGFEIAKTRLPDVIISDIMMPVEDGIAMCRRIKTTIETSHIPVILLTARTATPYKIGGLETGADDFITKPFDSDELVLKTKNILHARKAYLEKLSRTHDFQPEKIATTTVDEKFLKRLMEITEKHMENSLLSVEQIADELIVSRAVLFRKIKALTGNTPKGFIKSVRLKRAAQLLRDSDLRISQVSAKCGFKDAKYFSKVFRAAYNETPNEFVKNHKS